MDPVLRAVAAELPSAPATVFVGFSGGMDSTVLLHAAVRLGDARRVHAVHVNHQLQARAADWELHCRNVCAALGVALTVRRVRVSAAGSQEAAARDARYGAFRALAGVSGAVLLLAHHQGDQAETVLLRLLQGRGLYGMPARRPLGDGELRRPLLGLPREALTDYAKREGLSWVEDPANADLALDRNYLRRRVLPALRGRWPAAEHALLQVAAELELVDGLLLRTAALDAARPELPLAALQDHAPPDRPTLLRLWLQGRGDAIPSRRSLETFLEQLASGPDRQPALVLQRGTLRRYGDRLHHVPPSPRLEEAYPLSAPGTLRLPHGELHIEADPAGVPLRGPLMVGFRRGGERLRVRGCHRALKQLLQEARVPPWERGLLPLVWDEDGLAAVPGVAVRDAAGAAAGRRFRVRWIPAAARTS